MLYAREPEKPRSASQRARARTASDCAEKLDPLELLGTCIEGGDEGARFVENLLQLLAERSGANRCVLLMDEPSPERLVVAGLHGPGLDEDRAVELHGRALALHEGRSRARAFSIGDRSREDVARVAPAFAEVRLVLLADASGGLGVLALTFEEPPDGRARRFLVGLERDGQTLTRAIRVGMKIVGPASRIGTGARAASEDAGDDDLRSAFALSAPLRGALVDLASDVTDASSFFLANLGELTGLLECVCSRVEGGELADRCREGTLVLTDCEVGAERLRDAARRIAELAAGADAADRRLNLRALVQEAVRCSVRDAGRGLEVALRCDAEAEVRARRELLLHAFIDVGTSIICASEEEGFTDASVAVEVRVVGEAAIVEWTMESCDPADFEVPAERSTDPVLRPGRLAERVIVEHGGRLDFWSTAGHRSARVTLPVG